MASLNLHVGSITAQGVRANNEDNLLADTDHRLFLVADGMGGQESGEVASGLACTIIPKIVQENLIAERPVGEALVRALQEANHAICDAGASQPEGRRMGTTAVVAVQSNGSVYIASLGDSRAYLIRGDYVEQLTVDHTVAQALVASGTLTPEEAKESRYNNVLHKYLGCSQLSDPPDVSSFTPQPGDWLLLGTDGLTNHINHDDLRSHPATPADAQTWAEALVAKALQRGSRDNVTCVCVGFHGAA